MLARGQLLDLRPGLAELPPESVQLPGCDPVEVRQRELAVAGFDLPVHAGGGGLLFYPAQLAFELGLELAASFQLDVGPLQTAAGRDAPSPVDAESRGLFQREPARRRPTGDYGVYGALAQDAVASQPASPATARTSASRAREPLILYSVSPLREMRRVIETSP